MHKHTPTQRSYRQRNFDKGLCIYCSKPLPENDMRTGCEECRRKNNIRESVRRQEMRDFGRQE